jgi:hypothetical protein
MKEALFCFVLFVVATLRAAESPFTPPGFPLPKFPDRSYNVKDFGATGGGIINDTPAINNAISRCYAEGGGTVFFPDGRYAAGSIHLRSNVRLLLDADAVIFGLAGAFEAPEPNRFDKFQDFGHSHYHDALLYGENIENVAIVGGKINGGRAIGHGDPKAGSGNGDKLVAIKSGRNLDFENVTTAQGAHLDYLLENCAGVTFNRIVITEARGALDFESCSDVQVHDCTFTGCDDDTIGIKSDYSLGRKINSGNIYVWDCELDSGCNALQFGSETVGDISNCNFWNIRITRASKAGIGITSNDGSVIDGVNYSNIVIQGAACPIYMLVMDRLRSGEADKKVGAIKNVLLQDMTISDCASGKQGPVSTAAISGLPQSPLENVTMENVKINYPGGETDAAAADIVPPYMHGASSYSPRNLGPRPAAGLYVRHIEGLTLKNVQITFDRPDARPALIVSDADGVTLDNFSGQKSAAGKILRLDRVNNLTVTGSTGLTDQKSATVEKSLQ